MNTTLARIIKPPFAVFMIFGFLISFAIIQLLMNWIDFFAVVYDKPDLGYHELPSYIHRLQGFLRYAVWLILAAILALDLRKRIFIRTSGYISGLILAFMVSFVIFWVQWGQTMAEF